MCVDRDEKSFICVSGGTGSQVDSLFQSVGHVSRAVGTLVNIMTDDEAADGRTTATRAGPTRSSH